MSSIEDFREGNYVDFRGTTGRLSFAKITGIYTNDDRTINNYVLQHKDKNEFEGFESGNNSISQILLTPELLKKLKFIQEGNTEFFSLTQHTVSYIGYPDISNPEKPLYALPRMRIYKPFSDLYNARKKPLLQYFEENTIEITNVHMFQNYCTDNGLKIDFSILE